MNDPSRPVTEAPDAELLRLAQQGQQRRMETAATQDGKRQAASDLHLRTAVGAFRGSTLKRAFYGGALAGLLVVGVGAILLIRDAHDPAGGIVLGIGFTVAFALLTVSVFVPPLASRAAVAAEEAWASSFAFPLHGYFDVLGAAPCVTSNVCFQITWQPGGRSVDSDLLLSVVAAVDPQARLESETLDSARIVSGAINGMTAIRSGTRGYLCRNHEFPKRIHAIVDGALIPLHRSHPIRDVTLSRS